MHDSTVVVVVVIVVVVEVHREVHGGREGVRRLDIHSDMSARLVGVRRSRCAEPWVCCLLISVRAQLECETKAESSRGASKSGADTIGGLDTVASMLVVFLFSAIAIFHVFVRDGCTDSRGHVGEPIAEGLQEGFLAMPGNDMLSEVA